MANDGPSDDSSWARPRRRPQRDWREITDWQAQLILLAVPVFGLIYVGVGTDRRPTFAHWIGVLAVMLVSAFVFFQIVKRTRKPTESVTWRSGAVFGVVAVVGGRFVRELPAAALWYLLSGAVGGMTLGIALGSWVRDRAAQEPVEPVEPVEPAEQDREPTTGRHLRQ